MAVVAFLKCTKLFSSASSSAFSSLSLTHTHSSCMSDPLPEIQCRVQRLSDSFLKAAPQVSLHQRRDPALSLSAHSHTYLHLHYTISFSFQKVGSIPNQFPELRLHLSVSLYYKLLGAIIHDEESKNVDFGQLQACAYQTLSTSQFISLCVSPLQTMLEYEMLHKSLFALSVEIVLFSYNSQSRFVTYPLVLF